MPVVLSTVWTLSFPKISEPANQDTARSLLARSENDLLVKQRAMLAMQASYDKSAKRFADNQASIISITQDLRQLETKKATIVSMLSEPHSGSHH